MFTTINQDRRRFFSTAAMTLTAARLGMLGFVAQLLGCTPQQLRMGGEFPVLTSATTWLNSPPLTPAGLRGQVVLIDFCTYICINWLRQLPYVRAWAKKYKAHGLVVIGVHTYGGAFGARGIEQLRLVLVELQVAPLRAALHIANVWQKFQGEQFVGDQVDEHWLRQTVNETDGTAP